TDGASTWYACAGGPEKRPSGEPFRCGQPLLLAEDFDDPSAGRLAKVSPDPAHYEVGYRDGEYVLKKTDPRWAGGAAVAVPGRYGDVTIVADVRLVDGV